MFLSSIAVCYCSSYSDRMFVEGIQLGNIEELVVISVASLLVENIRPEKNTEV